VTPVTAGRFDLGCSPIVFDAEQYATLTRTGHRLQALLDGSTPPRDLNEGYFVRCVKEDADYDSHQCLEADAWRKMVERREFERLNPPPAAGQTWVRLYEPQPGVMLSSDGGGPLLFTCGLGVAYRGEPGHPHREYRLAPQFPWRRGDGYFRQVLNLTTNELQEFTMPSVHSKRHRAKSMEEYRRGSWALMPDWQQAVAAVDEPPREMLYVWRDPQDGEVLIADMDMGETFHIPPNQVAYNASWSMHPYDLLRVQFWGGQPVWVWGPV